MRSVSGAVLCLFVVVALYLPREVAASATDGGNPYQADFKLERVYQIASERGSKDEVQTVPTVRLAGQIRSVGFVDARFNVRRNKTWAASMRRLGRETKDEIAPVLLQGKLAAGGAWQKRGERIYPVAASIIGKEFKVSFPGRAKGSRKTWQRIYTIKMKLDGSLVVRARVSSIPKSATRRGGCGAANDGVSLSESVVPNLYAQGLEDGSGGEIVPPIANEDQPQGTSLARVVTISTDADPEWYLKYGDQSNAVIASFINSTEAIYNRQLGLRFRLVKQHVYADTSPYTTTDAGMLLSAFTRNVENAANLGENPATFHEDIDLKHLFTGKDIDGSIIGIAYIGVLCAVPSLSFGISQSYMEGATAGIFAHELGHNFGASHDSSTREGLMYPSISIPPAQKFSDFSVGEISSHLSKYGSCISLEQMTPRSDVTPEVNPNYPSEPPLSSASIKINRARVGERSDPILRLSGSLESQVGLPIASVGVNLMVAGERVGNAVTAADGSFDFFVRLVLPRGQKVYVYVETEGGEIYSNFLWLGGTSITESRSGRSGYNGRGRR
jgi:hypothetical protein